MGSFYKKIINLDKSIITKTGYYAKEFTFSKRYGSTRQVFKMDKHTLTNLLKLFYIYETIPPKWHNQKILFFDFGGTINGQFFNYKNKSQTEILTFLLKINEILFGNPLIKNKEEIVDSLLDKVDALSNKRDSLLGRARSSKKSNLTDKLLNDIESTLKKATETMEDIAADHNRTEDYIKTLFDYHTTSSTRSPESLINFLKQRTTTSKDIFILTAYFNPNTFNGAQSIQADKNFYLQNFKQLNFISLEEIYHIRDNDEIEDMRLTERERLDFEGYFLSRAEIEEKRKVNDLLRTLDNTRNLRNRKNNLERNLTELQAYLSTTPILNRSEEIQKGLKRLQQSARNI